MKRQLEVQQINDNFIFYFDDVLENILSYLDIGELLNYELVSVYHKNFVRNCNFINKSIKMNVAPSHYMYQIISYHHFKNMDLSYLYVRNKDLHLLQHCKVLNICNTNVKDISYLTGNYDLIKTDLVPSIYRCLLDDKLENKSLLNVRDGSGNTLLIYCIIYHKNIEEIRKVLGLCQKDINVLNDQHKGVLYHALLKKDTKMDTKIVDILLEYNIDCNILVPFTKNIKVIRNRKTDVVHFCLFVGWYEMATKLINYCDTVSGETLLSAIRHKQTELVKILVKKGVDIRYVDKFGFNALYYAVAVNSLECVKMFNDNGCYSDTLLLRAAKHKNKEMISLLYKNKEDNKLLMEKYHKKSYFDFDICYYFVSLGENITYNCLCNYFLCHEGSVADWEYFSKFGFDLSEVGNNLLFYALQYESEELAYYLSKSMSVCWKDHLLMALKYNKSVKIVNCLLEKCGIVDGLLSYAIKHQCDINVVRLLVNKQKNNDPTVLFNLIKNYELYGMFFNHFLYYDEEVLIKAMIVAIKHNVLPAVKVLLTKVNVDSIYEGYSLLMHAIMNQKSSIVEYLIKKGANVNQFSYKNKPVLYYAVKNCYLRELVDAGANVNVSFCYKMEEINLLLYVIINKYDYNDCITCYELIKSGVNVNFTTKKGVNAFTLLLHMDCTRNNVHFILCLLDNKGNKFLVDNEAWEKYLEEVKDHYMIREYEELKYMLMM